MHDLYNNVLAHQPVVAESYADITMPSADMMADLPPADTKRWVVRRKEQVVQAVQAGQLTRAQACAYYQLSDEEYQSWEDHLLQHGLRGLRVTRLQDYRRHGEPESNSNIARRA